MSATQLHLPIVVPVTAHLLHVDGRRIEKDRVAFDGPMDIEVKRDKVAGIRSWADAVLACYENDFHRLLREVALHYGYSPEDLVGRCRSQRLADARHVAMTLAKEILRLNLEDVGQLFGGRDHGTVIHAQKKILGTPYDWRRQEVGLVRNRVLEVLKKQSANGHA